MAFKASGPLEGLLAQLNVGPVDVVFRGDGSGISEESNPSGFACTIAHYDGRTDVVYGAYSCGTSMTAELDAYLLALRHYDVHPGRHPRPRIAIVCDNQTVVMQGRGEYKRKKHGASWSAVDFYVRQGWTLKWFWAGRNSEVGMSFCDHLSREARLAMEVAAGNLEKRFGVKRRVG